MTMTNITKMGIEIFHSFEKIQKILLRDIPADAFEALPEKRFCVPQNAQKKPPKHSHNHLIM